MKNVVPTTIDPTLAADPAADQVADPEADVVVRRIRAVADTGEEAEPDLTLEKRFAASVPRISKSATGVPTASGVL